MDTDPNAAFTVVAAGLAVASVVCAVVDGLRTRPRRPSPGPTTMELGTDPPAIVDLLTDDFAVTRAAVPATVLDLATRRWLEVEEVAGGHTIIRLRQRPPSDVLAPYEQRVLDHLRRLAIDGVVPAEAMTTGPRDASNRWWRAFRREVISDAHERGLCRDRWAPGTVAALWAGVLATGAALWLAERRGDPADAGSGYDPSMWLWAGALFATAGLFVWLLVLPGRDLQRDTDAGLAAASRWLGVREHLSSAGEFGDKPAASVVLWERHLAMAVALDLAPVALSQLPLGAEDHRHAWSRASGRWRHVTVRYPWLRPGYGQHPLLAALGALAAGIAGVAVIVFVVRVRRDEIGIIEDLPSGAASTVDGVALLVGVVAGLVVAWNAVKLVFAVGDLVQTDTVEGVVVRRRVRWGWFRLHDEADTGPHERATPRYFCALDTGGGRVIVAWRVRGSVYDAIDQGERYRVRVTRRLRYVRSAAPAPPDDPTGTAH